MASSTSIDDIEDILQKRDEFPSCSCAKCASACYVMPGIYDPKHILHMLKEGETTIGNLVDNSVVDFYMGTPSHFFIRPRIQTEEGGSMVNLIPEAEKCVHLGERGCTLSRGNRPIECITAYSCRVEPRHVGKPHSEILWSTPEGREVIRLFEAEVHRRDEEKGLPWRIMGDEYVRSINQSLMQNPMLSLLMRLELMKMQIKRKEAEELITSSS